MASPPNALSRPFSERTAWARNLAAPVRDFLNTESASAMALLAAAVAAMVWANSPWSDSYESVWSTDLSIRVGSEGLSLELREWVSEGLMAFFFLVVGLEARREFDLGALRERRRIALVAMAALGGMAVSVLIYLAFNAGGAGAGGWGAAMSTDTAFALGVLALVAPAATQLRVRLLSIVVIDDLVALLVIATVYTEEVDVVALAVAAGLFVLMLALRYAPVAWRGPTAAFVGVGVWVALHESGVDPLLAGLAVGLAVSAYPPARTDLERVTELTRSFREQPTPALARSAQLGVSSAVSTNERLQYRLHPWTSFVIVPLFALANVGIEVDGQLLEDAVTSPITLGIVFGYVIGKPVGVVAAAWLGTRRWTTGLRPTLSWPAIVGGGVAAGIPFTVSLLIAGIAFEGRELEEAKLGVLAAAILASLVSLAVFRLIRRIPTEKRARQMLGTADELLDLSDDVDPERDHIRGPASAPVTLIEYGDYQCPVLRGGGGRDSGAAGRVRRRAALRLAPPATQRRSLQRPDGRRGGRGGRRSGGLLANARQAARLPGRAVRGRPQAQRPGARPRPRTLLGRASPARVPRRAWPRTWPAPTRAGWRARPASSSTDDATRGRTTPRPSARPSDRARARARLREKAEPPAS